MQIDELPAGEQTRHPDLDMNQVVGLSLIHISEPTRP